MKAIKTEPGRKRLIGNEHGTLRQMIYCPPELWIMIKCIAAATKTSAAEYIRESIANRIDFDLRNARVSARFVDLLGQFLQREDRFYATYIGQKKLEQPYDPATDPKLLKYLNTE